MTFHPYIKCKVCGGDGHYPKVEHVGGQEIEYNVKCEYCSNGWVNRNKLRLKPLVDRWGRPIDRFGRVITDLSKEEWLRKQRRNQLIKEYNK